MPKITASLLISVLLVSSFSPLSFASVVTKKDYPVLQTKTHSSKHKNVALKLATKKVSANPKISFKSKKKVSQAKNKTKSHRAESRRHLAKSSIHKFTPLPPIPSHYIVRYRIKSPPQPQANFTPVAAITPGKLLTGKQQYLLNYAKQYLGTRYIYGGYSPVRGFDCSGFVSYVYKKAAGISLPHNAFAMSKTGLKIYRQQLAPGDLVLFKNVRHPVSHVGIYLGGDHFIHASRSSGGKVRISDLRTNYWTKHFIGGRRYI